MGDYKTIKGNRLDYIDALRGIAILGVILVHTSQGIEGLPQILVNACAQGEKGVQLFFIVSAVTLFMSMNNRENFESHLTINFYIRRLFRIAPLYYAGIIFYVLLDGFSPRYWAPDGITWIDVIANFFFLHEWTPTSINSVVPGGWSIAVEMCFYIFVPYLYKNITTLEKALWITLTSLIFSRVINSALIIIISPYYTESNIYLLDLFKSLWFPSQVPIFFLGITLYFILQKNDLVGPSNVSKKNNKSFSLFLLTISFYLMYSSTFGSYLNLSTRFVYGISFLFLAYSLALYPNIFFVNKIICFIGEISYSIYMWHFFIIRVITQIVEDYLIVHNVSPVISLIIYLMLTILVSSIIGYISYHIIEVPGIKIGTDFRKRYIQEPLKNNSSKTTV